MNDSIKITSFELENVKKIKAVAYEPTEAGLTVIGGRNGQGKTSVLDSIAWTLGGAKFRPSEPHRAGSVLEPALSITLSNGLRVERKGANSDLKITDPSGKKAGQRLLDSFIGEVALNIPKFMEASEKEKADYLLQVIGVGDQLVAMDRQERTLYDQRRLVGDDYRRKKKHAESLAHYDDVGETEISVSELLQKHQAVLLKNAENARKRSQLSEYQHELEEVEKQLQILLKKKQMLLESISIAQKDVIDLFDESTEAIESQMMQIETTNNKIRENQRKRQALAEADQLQIEYQEYSAQINEIRENRQKLLEDAKLPLPGLSVKDGALVYQGARWDGMSGADQLRVATAICRAINPKCGFILLDKLEQMDTDTLKEFGAWLESEGIQAIATRVSTGDECTLIIEDGLVKGREEDWMLSDPGASEEGDEDIENYVW